MKKKITLAFSVGLIVAGFLVASNLPNNTANAAGSCPLEGTSECPIQECWGVKGK